ncbi:MAG: hypothetical protein ACRCV5_07465, partial [Afipia sp.]
MQLLRQREPTSPVAAKSSHAWQISIARMISFILIAVRERNAILATQWCDFVAALFKSEKL